jgi:hypothetical protein
VVPSASRLPFLLAVALIAAAVGDPLVETVSNSGLFGYGYNDNNHLSVIPVLVAGSILALVVIVSRSLSLFHRGSMLRRGDWVVESATRLSRQSALSDVPLVLAMQFAALFMMESVEQLAFGGKLLGGIVWLGGPVLFSLVTHAVLGTACTLLLAALARSILATVASFVREAVDAILVSLARDAERAFIKRRADAWLPRAQAPHVRQVGSRAPPSLPVAA